MNKFMYVIKDSNGAVLGFITGSIVSIILAYFVFTGEDFIEFAKVLRDFAEMGLITHFLFCKIDKKK